jgi:hypothetical protein
MPGVTRSPACLAARTVAAGSLALAALGCGGKPAAPPPKASPPGPPPGLKASDESVGWIAGGRLISFFAIEPERDPSLWLTRADGTQTRMVGSNAYDTWISPSGSIVATAEYGKAAVTLILKRPSGEQLGRLRIPAVDPSLEQVESVAWPPDEDSIVFALATEDTSTIFAKSPGGAVRMISPSLQGEDVGPEWSPDARWILFDRCRTHSLTYNCKPMRMRPDGRERARREGISVEAGGRSPDKRWVAFTSTVGPRLPYPGDTGGERRRWGIYVRRANGSGLTRLAVTPPTESLVHIAWSPDSTRLVFADTSGLSLAQLRGGKVRHLTSKGGSSPYPEYGDNVSSVSWAPAARILFVDHGVIYALVPGRPPAPVILRGS